MADRIIFDTAWFAGQSSTKGLAASDLAPACDWTAMKDTDHFVQFYESDEFLANSVAEYVFHGLKAGETCIVVTTREHLAVIHWILAKFISRMPQPFGGGRYITLDARETLDKFMVDGRPDEALFQEAVGSVVEEECAKGDVRAFGEMVALLVAEGNPEAALELEGLWNKLRDKHAFALYCAYSVDELAANGKGSMPDICGTHSRVVPSESYVSLATADERLRAVAYLQHRNKQLEAELAVLQDRISKKNVPSPSQRPQ